MLADGDAIFPLDVDDQVERFWPLYGEELLVLQASFLDCVPFDPFSFQQDCLTPPEVHVGRCQIAQAFMIASVTVVISLGSGSALAADIAMRARSLTR